MFLGASHTFTDHAYSTRRKAAEPPSAVSGVPPVAQARGGVAKEIGTSFIVASCEGSVPTNSEHAFW